ncbi:MAG: peptidase U32 family protein [Duodenibacillus sp.]|nr:peptidase U32 family protein [Duodenibacillus sp.]
MHSSNTSLTDRSELELMAPAGGWDTLSAALANGADSVYFGVGELNMRSLSSRAFTRACLPEVMDRIHDAGRLGYLTVNTVIFDDDAQALEQLLEAARQASVDAVIASDVAVLMRCRALGLPVHLSTQLNIANVEALRFYAQFADVAVLARELTLEQVARITRAVRQEGICGPSGQLMRVEMFCHGALCMAVSGRCYMSLHTRGKSANRGECLQTCRRTYTIHDAERDIALTLDAGTVMSPKDLKTIDFVDRMVNAGVRVFKIEGRARSAEYVQHVVSCYDAALRAACRGGATEAEKALWNTRLGEVFHRGFWDGYYLGAQVAALTDASGSKASLVKRHVGRCTNYFARVGVAQFVIEAEGFAKGARLLVVGPTTGAVEFEAESIVRDDAAQNEARKGESVTLTVPGRVRENDKLYVLEPRG